MPVGRSKLSPCTKNPTGMPRPRAPMWAALCACARMKPTPGNERLLTLYNRASLDVGAGQVTAVNPDRAGAADVSFIAAQARMILDGVGLMGTGGHTVNETADLRTLLSMSKRMAVLLARIQRDGAK